MQRKQFEAIARVIREELPSGFDYQIFNLSETSYREQVAREFADMLKATNPNFNWERFMLACEVDPEAEVMNPKAQYVMGIWMEEK